MTAADAAAPVTALRSGSRDDPVSEVWRTLLSADLDRYRALLAEALAPQRDYLTDAERALYDGGKKVRPLLLALSAHLVHGPGELPDKAARGAVSLEMLHVATLIHDDVVDESAVRRGVPSVNAARGPGQAIIVGDMQFVQAVRGFVECIDSDRDLGLVKSVLDVAHRICCGELDELRVDPSWRTEVLLERYWRTIDRKTAVLFALACECGIALVDGRTRDVRRIGHYGRRVGRAFQVMDDLFDLTQDESASGKPRGVDIARRRLSLPIVYAMAELGDGHRLSRFMRGDGPPPDDLTPLVDDVRATAGFARAYADARRQALDALEYLRPFPRNPYRDALERIALHVVDRGR
ncbi:polyprenyl synthetase family protein [Saccharothrix texasensis]|uniref:Heptaprenyl diphosphate synthase n=1 Tax=Saccharothrix texasensis TaxID=103734 RepID=A0A3N1GX09_9PSEU|nr:polyprenyl synthetase family protein [Saccharothrix texasensis]ROP34841.1 heptaprenyl diphosphate synthase [Saccharothrix texasensis]